MITIFGSSYKLVIFDLDGTLIDSLSLWVDLFREAFARRDLEVTDEQIVEIAFYHGHRIREMGVTDVDAFWTEMVRDSETKLLAAPLFDEVTTLFKMLKDREVQIAIYTGTNRPAASNILRLYGLETYVDVTVTGSDVHKRKPDPEGALNILSQTQCPATETLYIGDTVVDQDTAMNAGVAFLYYHQESNLRYMPKESAVKLEKEKLQIHSYEQFMTLIQ